jgi:serine/threonine-protein phosphatase 2A regulatory subunit B'
MVERLRRCCEMHDFSGAHARSQLAEKELKRRTLLDILDYVHLAPGVFTGGGALAALVRLVEANLFRSMPSRGSRLAPSVASSASAQVSSTQPAPRLSAERGGGAAASAGGDDRGGDGGEENENREVLDPAWPHLHVVYELLLRFAVSRDGMPRETRRFMGRRFHSRLLALLQSADPRERDYVKTIMHGLYVRNMPVRVFLRQRMGDALLSVVHERRFHAGVSEILEILGSVVSGFAVPLRPDHLVLLGRVLMPLHTAPGFPTFHGELVTVLSLFLEKDPSSTVNVIMRGLVRVWPWQSSSKIVLLLNELEDFLDQTPPAEFARVSEQLLRVLARCMQSSHLQVAERALRLWNNQYFMSLVAQQRVCIFPVVYRALRAILVSGDQQQQQQQQLLQLQQQRLRSAASMATPGRGVAPAQRGHDRNDGGSDGSEGCDAGGVGGSTGGKTSGGENKGSVDTHVGENNLEEQSEGKTATDDALASTDLGGGGGGARTDMDASPASPASPAGIPRNRAPLWNESVISLANSLLQVLAKMDPALFSQTCAQHEQVEARRRVEQAARTAYWEWAETIPPHGRKSMSPPPQMAGLQAAEC